MKTLLPKLSAHAPQTLQYFGILVITVLVYGCASVKTSAPSPAVSSEEVFQPVTFANKNSLVFVPDPRLDFGSRGTIEIIFKASPFHSGTGEHLRDMGDNMPVIDHDTVPDHVLVSNGAAGRSRFSVFLNQSLTRIGLSDGKKYASVQHNFRDGEWHHVALATDHDHTTIIIDNVEIDQIPVGYSEESALPLLIGTFDGISDPFYGEISSVRIWGQPLSADEISKNAFFGLVRLDEDYVQSLLAYSFFTNQRQDLHYTHEILSWTGAYNRGGGGMQKMVLPRDAVPEKFVVRRDSQMIYALGVEYQVPDEDVESTIRWFPYGSGSLQQGELWEFDVHPEKGESLTGIAGSYTPDATLKGLRFITNQRTSELCSTSVIGEVPFVVRIPAGYKLGGFQGEGLNDGNVLQSIGLGFKPDTVLALMDLRLFTHELAGEPVRNDHLARNHLPALKDIRDGGLHLHGNYTSHPVFHFQYDIVQDAIIVEWEFPAHVYVPSREFAEKIFNMIYDEIPAEINVSAGSESEGFSVGASGPSLDEEQRYQDSLAAFMELYTKPRFTPARTFGPVKFTNESGARYVHENGSVLSMIDAETFQLEGSIYGMMNGTYRKSKSYPAGDSSQKEPWGATFTLDQRPPLLEFNFRGYHIAKMDPQNYQLGTGTNNNVFKYPDDTGRDYHYTTNGKIVPHGLYYRNDREAMQRARSHTIESEREHQQAWSINLGLSIGVPGMSFGASGSHKESVERMNRTSKTNALSIAFETKRALVLDKTRMRLDPDFREAVYTLRDRYLSLGVNAFLYDPEHRDPFGTFIERYGSHYPYAVTYGGMAYQETAMTAETRQTIKSQETSIEASASGSLEGVTLGGNIGGGWSNSDKVQNSMDSSRTHTRTVGGELSMSGQSGSWSLPEHSEVPVLLDLRPIYELFSPIYFEDPVIWKDLRSGLQDNLAKYDQSRIWSDVSWDSIPKPATFKINIEEIRNVLAGEPPPAASLLTFAPPDVVSEYFGTIKMTVGGKEIDVWCARKGNSNDFRCPPPLQLADAGSAALAGKQTNIHRFGFSHEYEISESEYCNGKLTITVDIDEDDDPDTQELETQDNPIEIPWRALGAGQAMRRITPFSHKDGLEFTLFLLVYSVEANQHNFKCPND